MPSNRSAPSEPAPASALVLAAVERAVRHAPQPGADASTATVLAHLGLGARSAAARRARAALARLHATGMLARSRAHGRTRWRLAARGRTRLGALRRAGAVPAPAESPQHRAWRAASAAAGREIGRFRDDLTVILRELETAALGDPPAASDVLFALGAHAGAATRRLASASYCLREWREPGDEAADVDRLDEPAAAGARRVPHERLRALRTGRRNVRLWDQPF